MNSPTGSRRATFQAYSATARQRRAQLLKDQQNPENASEYENAIEEYPQTRPRSAPLPKIDHQSRQGDSGPMSRLYLPVGHAMQANISLARNISMTSLLRYFNRDRFDQDDLSRVTSAAQSQIQSPHSVSSPDKLEIPQERESSAGEEPDTPQYISFQNIIYEVRPGDCPHCSGHSYIPLRFASHPRMPGSWDDSCLLDKDIIIEDLSQFLTTPPTKLIQHHHLCPRYRSKGRADWHWEDQRPMWLPQLSENFALYKSDWVHHPRDLWRDYEVSRAWAQGRKAVVRRHIGEPHHEIADIPAKVSENPEEGEKMIEKVRKFTMEDLDK